MPLIYINRPYFWLFLLTFLACCIIELLGPARWRGSGGQNHDRHSTLVLNTSVLVTLFLYFVWPFVFPSATLSQPVVFFAGLVLVGLGMAWRWYAIRTLKSYFTGIIMIQTDQQIVQHGPYRFIRHPAYSGILVAGIGIGFMMGNWASLFTLMIGLSIGLLYRIKVEEEALRHQIASYEAYMQHTKRLIPFVF